MTFDPNGVGIANGNLFGFPVSENEADIVITPIPWDVTASYGKGTSKGPQAILDASPQLDFYHPQLEDAWKTKVYMSPISKEWQAINDDFHEKVIDYIQFLEDGGKLDDNLAFQTLVKNVNKAQTALENNLKEHALDLFKQGKTPAVLGGEHSTPLGLIRAIDELEIPFGVLQIDAHADLRKAYEGFEQSHASIMYNVVTKCKNLQKLVQVGIRDIAQSEVEMSNDNERIKTFYDWNIKKDLYEGKKWSTITNEIIDELPEIVYISFDIDGLKPYLCPNTGTPVAGGFELEDINYLFFKLIEKGKKIIAFDLNEVAPEDDGDWNANVGARALWNLICVTEKSRRKYGSLSGNR